MPHWSIRSKVLVLALLPSLLIALLLGSHQVFQRAGEYRELLNRHGVTSSLQLATIARIGLRQKNTTILRELLQSSLDASNIRAVAVYDNYRHIIERAGPNMLSVDGDKLRLTNQPTQAKTAHSMRFVSPIYKRQQNIPDNSISQIIGWAEVELYLQGPEEQTYTNIFISCILILLALALSSGLAILVGLDIRSKTAAIGRAIDSIKSGNLNTVITIDGSDEIARLSEKINAMTDTLQQNSIDMEYNIEQTTGDLRETLETIEIQNIELDISRREALEASRIKSEFLANTSHEIRTPLNGIIGFSNILLKDIQDPHQQDQLNTIRHSAESLLAIINDILDLSKIEAGKLVLDNTAFNIRDALEDTLTILAPAAYNKNIELILITDNDVPATIIGDPLRIRQVTTNLISNAIKFTDVGDIVILIKLLEIKDSSVTLSISVTDSGIGLSENQQKTIFQAFTQANASTSREYGGTGLGLAISRRLVEQMNGTLTIKSELGKGSTFTFSMRANLSSNTKQHRPMDKLIDQHIGIYANDDCMVAALTHHIDSWQAHSVNITQAKNNLQKQHLGAIIIAPSHDDLKPEKTNKIIDFCLQNYPCRLILLLPTGINGLVSSELIDRGQCLVLTRPISHNKLYQALDSRINDYDVATLNHSPLALVAHQKLQVLAVDDNPSNLQLLCILLEDMGAEITTANNGQEAIDLADSDVFDIIYMDIQMPIVDGIQAVQHIRTRSTHNKNTPIIAVTAHAQAEEKKNLSLAGFNDHVSKPIDLKILQKTVLSWTAYGELPPIRTEGANQDRLTAKPVDTSQCLSRANNLPDLAIEMLTGLIDLLPSDLSHIRRLQQEQNSRSLLEACHKLHGATCYTGTPKLQQIVSSLESELKQHQDTKPSEKAARLVEELLVAGEELIKWQQAHDIEFLLSDHQH